MDQDCEYKVACLPPEVCNNGIDDDGNGLIDCEDWTCAAGPTCPFSTVCAIDQLQFGWPQGYCTEFCDLSTNDCPAGSTCAPMLNRSGGAGLCMASCVVDADCRSGYTCADIGGSKVCFDL
ncbi:MAG TPA: hypothetical protein VE093_01525 [Polyangiaceae bacterium]|jgi:hypothetical protein|nr:hypothetical protein [Polyangiaceae bacterium]